MRSSSIFQLVVLKHCCIPKISSLGCPEQNWGRLPFIKYWGCLPYFKYNEVVFHISSSWVKIRLHTKNQLLSLTRNKLRSFSNWNKLRSSSIFKNIEVVFHISSSWVKISFLGYLEVELGWGCGWAVTIIAILLSL